MIHLKTLHEVNQIEYSSKMVAEILQLCYEYIKPGVATLELEEIADKYCLDKNVRPSFKGYMGFPHSICVCINDEVVHGFPSKRIIQEGDIVSVDCGIERNGYYSDAAFTKIVGDVSYRIRKLVETTEKCLYKGISKATHYNRLHDISSAIEDSAAEQMFSVVKEYTGHGVGFAVHESPTVPNYVGKGINYILKVGMVIAIEPMLMCGNSGIGVESNGWIVKTTDGKPAAHFEHSIVILEDGPRILTKL